MNANLRYLAALHGLGTLDADAMKSAVDSLMNQGFYVDECLDALDSEPARVDEVLPAFRAALAHYGVVVPDRELAVWQLIEHHLKRAASPDGDSWASLCSLFRDLYWEYDFHSETAQYLGDSHGLQELIGIYWAVEDQAGQSGVSTNAFQVDESDRSAIRHAAERWLASYGTKSAA